MYLGELRRKAVSAIVAITLAVGLCPMPALAVQGAAYESAQVPELAPQSELDGSTDLEDGYFFLFDGDTEISKDYYVDAGGTVSPKVTMYYISDDEPEDAEGRTILSPSKYALAFERYSDNFEYVPATAPFGVGRYRVVATAVEGSGLTGSTSMGFTVYDRHDLDGAEVVFDDKYLDENSYNYYFPVGGYVEPKVTIDGTVLPRSAYTLRYGDNTTLEDLNIDKPSAEGYYYVYAEGVAPYFGEAFNMFYISNTTKPSKQLVDIEDAVITGLSSKTYTGSAIVQPPTVKYGTTLLANGVDYTYSTSNNVKAGTATVTVRGMGAYTGTKTATFAISKASISKAKFSKIKAQKYKKGKAVKPAVTVKFGGKKLAKGKDYTVTYKNNKKKGKNAQAIVKGKGNFKGSKTVKFTIK